MEGVETAFSASQALLERTSVQELCKAGQKIVLLEHNQTFGDALKSLSKSQILSAPMVRGEAQLGDSCQGWHCRDGRHCGGHCLVCLAVLLAPQIAICCQACFFWAGGN